MAYYPEYCLLPLANHVDLLVCVLIIKSTLPTMYGVDCPIVLGTIMIFHECGTI